MDEQREQRRGGMRTFALGSVVGASATLAAMARRRRIARRRGRPRGLAAFETAPCHVEFLAEERETSDIQRAK